MTLSALLGLAGCIPYPPGNAPWVAGWRGDVLASHPLHYDIDDPERRRPAYDPERIREIAGKLDVARLQRYRIRIALQEAHKRPREALAADEGEPAVEEARDTGRVADARRRAGAPHARKSTRRARWATEGRSTQEPSREELEAIEQELARAFPWLRRLSNGRFVLALYARRVAWTQIARAAAEARDALPDPADTIVSAEKDRRARARAPLEKRRLDAARMLRALPSHTSIVIRELLADDFFKAPTNMERVARRMVAEELGRRNCTVGLDMRSGTAEVRVYVDGAWLRLQDGRLHLDALFERPDVPLLEVQAVYYATVVELGEHEIAAVIKEHPWIPGVLLEYELDRIIAEDRTAAVAEEMGLVPVEQAEIDEIVRERRDTAEAVRLRVVGVMVAVTIVARFFAVEGASDLFLMWFPGGKAAEQVTKLVKLRRARKAARELERLGAMLDDRQAEFMQLVVRMSRRELAALRGIRKHVGKPELVNWLMTRADRGLVDLVWLRKMLDKKRINEKFVESFMRYDANPTWRDLKGVLENRIDPKSRKSFMSKLTGFLGEEAAAKYLVKDADIKTKFFKNHEAKFIVRRGDKYLDLTAHDPKKNVVVFAEVKNWSAGHWYVDRNKVAKQLRAHNERIALITQKAHDGTGPTEIHKVLMVSEGGWDELSDAVRNELEAEFHGAGGWTVEKIPEYMIESGDQFIDRMRR